MKIPNIVIFLGIIGLSRDVIGEGALALP